MRLYHKIRPLILLAVLGLLAVPAQAQTAGNCNLGSADAFLDVNNVRARLFNNGSLFWRGSGFVYTVPKTGSANAIFASGIWIGGRVDGTVRFAGTTYGPFEYWPGPLDDNGNPPGDCTPFDRMYTITSEALANYEQTGTATPDMRDWPAELGAPVVDGDGNPNNYDLAAGDRPELLGDQTVWWVMNDVGGSKGWSQTAPLGMEIQVTAFAFNTADALNNTTFYKYKLIYKGQQPLTDTWFGIFSDPDLGDAADDFVGSDTTLGLGFAYNGDENDEGFDGYGTRPPAVGYDFFQGPLVNNDGVDNDGDGETDEEDERLQMERFVYWLNQGGIPFGSPSGSEGDGYRYLQGIWRDDTPMTLGGVGHGGSEVVNYMFPGDPVQRAFWSEENTDGQGSRNVPSDRRFLETTGPFTMQPGDEQEIVFGIVWSQSVSRLASIAQLKRDDILAQGAFDNNFSIPAPPDQPRVSAEVLDETVVLTWDYPSTSNNFLNSYEVPSPFLEDPNPVDGNTTFTFEGYKIYQYRSPQDQNGEVIATLDVVNDVTQIIDEDIDVSTGAVVTRVVANGGDNGVRNFFELSGLTNYTEYHFGVQAYAYNPNSIPKIYASPINRVTVTPTRVEGRGGGTSFTAESGQALVSERTAGTGGGAFTDPAGVQFVGGKIVDPLAVTGATYEARFYETALNDSTTVLTYDLVNTTTGETVVSGADRIARTGNPAPLGADIFVVDGVSFTISGPSAAPLVVDGSNMFVEVQAPGGGDPCAGGGAFGCAEVGGDLLDSSFNSTGDYILTNISAGSAETIGAFAPHDFEIRFTEEGSYAEFFFQQEEDGSWNGIPVPFEVWDIGIVGPFGENDPSDDVRLIPVLFADDGSTCDFAYGAGTAFSRPASDRIYAYYPVSTYQEWEDAVKPVVDASPNQCTDIVQFESFIDTGRGRPIQRQVIVDNTAGAVPVDQLTGAIIRFYTTKPLAAGDVYEISTGGLEPVQNDPVAAEVNLDAIGIVPNPYKGSSAYETSVTQDVVRFTNLPDQATIRVYTLSGTLIRTMNLGTFNNEWDLKTDNGLDIASGIYLIHVDVPDVGERILKFGVVKKRIQLDLL